MSTNKETKRIFLDYAAGTPVSKRALQTYCDTSQYFANPQALHSEGLEAALHLDTARRSIAKHLEVKASNLIFTSGGTESNNLAIAGYLFALEQAGKKISECHILVSAIEHPSVQEVYAPFVERGLSVSLIAPNEHGEIKPEAVAEALQENTVLVSIALVNSEIGTVQPLHAIAKVIKTYSSQLGGPTPKLGGVVLHTDASQGMYENLFPHGLGVDLMTLDSGKMYGPRGAGVLYIRNGVSIAPVCRGGSQEGGIRPGTENVALNVAFADAFSEVNELKELEITRLSEIHDTLLEKLQQKIPDMVLNGSTKHQSPHIINISIPKIDSEYVAMYLDQRGISLSTKSACLERKDANESFVVKALGGAPWRSTNTLRFSFGRDTREEDIPLIVSKVYEAIETYKNFNK